MHLSIGQVDCKNHLSECTIPLSEIYKANATYVKIRNTQSSVGQVLQVFHLSDSFLLISDDRTSEISNPEIGFQIHTLHLFTSLYYLYLHICPTVEDYYFMTFDITQSELFLITIQVTKCSSCCCIDQGQLVITLWTPTGFYTTIAHV